MKIGIDVDNTITTTMPILKKYCKKYNDEVVKRGLKMNEKGYSSSNLYNWTDEENFIFCNKYLREIVLQAEMKENAKNIIEKIKNDGNEIYIMTARHEPRFIKPYETTKEQLDSFGITYDEIIANCVDKYKYCLENGIELMIEDEPHNVNSISNAIPVIVFKGIHNEDCKGKNVIKVDTWNEVYEQYLRIKNN